METWLINDDFVLPPWLQKYTPFTSKAVKTSVRGRAGGGLLKLIHERLVNSVSVTECCRYWLFINTGIETVPMIIGNIHLPPSCDTDSCLDELTNTVINITNSFPDHGLILTGDYNAHVGDLNNLEEEILANTDLYDLRLVSHKNINRRGRFLVDAMESLGLILCNGRSNSDRPGENTYISQVGRSTIDLAWINEKCFSIFKDFKVISVSDLVDHLACITTLQIITAKPKAQFLDKSLTKGL